MSFNSKLSIEQINKSMNSMLLLHSSCQAIIETSIEKVISSWYDILDHELGEAENLVVEWRQSGYLYFHQDILSEIINYGEFFISVQIELNELFQQIEKDFSEKIKEKLVVKLNCLIPPVNSMIEHIDGYLSKLKSFEADMSKPQSEMERTIQQVQANEAEIQSEIAVINEQISLLHNEIKTDREAIAKAKKTRDKGVVETIFGIILVPFTGGFSLILAGVGVATIAEAEDKVKSLQSKISKYQSEIAGEQTKLSKDHKIIVTLNGLTMSTQTVLDDITLITAALDSLRTSWSILEGELSGEVNKVSKASSAKEICAIEAWYMAASNEWGAIVKHTKDLAQRTILTTHVTIG